MWEPLEIVTASLMQNIVQIPTKNAYFVTKLLFRNVGKSYLGALGVESPHGGAIYMACSIVLHAALCGPATFIACPFVLCFLPSVGWLFL